MIKRSQTWTEEERELNAARILAVKAHTYPLVNNDVADIIGIAHNSYSKLLTSRSWMSIERYEQLMDVDVALSLEAVPDMHRRTKKRLLKVVDEYEDAKQALAIFF